MAKDNSFDIVSEVDGQELDNAFQQAKREIKNRYDLKDSGSDITYDKQAQTITIIAPSDFVCGQVRDIVLSKCIKRKIDNSALKWGKIEPAAGATVRQVASVISGLDKELTSKINKDIKSFKLKVKPTTEGDKIRVSSPSRDALQDVIKRLSEKDYGQPLQFTNYR